MTDAPQAAPVRIPRKRTKGWCMPEGAVHVGRRSRWGDPIPIEPTGHFDAAGRAQYVAGLTRAELSAIRRELRGKTLACWCPLTCPDGTPRPCRANVLLEIANA